MYFGTAMFILLLAGLLWLASITAAWVGAFLLIPLAVYVWLLSFFRDPQRTIPAEKGLFVSPADGTVADITRLGEESALGRKAVSVGVFMSVFNVHVNRSPFAGTITEIKHADGAFLDVRKPEAWMANESTLVAMEIEYNGQSYPIAYRQIAGFVARRIVTTVEVGDRVDRGQRVGMIKFGSRLELIVPEELVGEVRVAIGERVAGGSTVLISAKEGNHDSE